MIHDNFLFFHIPKSGGSSIEKMFLKEHRQLDFVIRFIFRESKFSQWMVSSMRYKNWRNFIFGLVSLFLCDKEHLWGIYKDKVLHHLTYMEIYKKQKTYIKNQLKNYVKFSVVRNPYDRIISAYHFMGHGLTFNKFVSWVYGELDKYYRYNVVPFVVILPQWEFIINENGQNGMDETLRFESLREDFMDFQRKYNLDMGELPHINSRKRFNKNIKTYFTPKLEEMVYHMYKWDFKMFGYKRIHIKPPKES